MIARQKRYDDLVQWFGLSHVDVGWRMSTDALDIHKIIVQILRWGDPGSPALHVRGVVGGISIRTRDELSDAVSVATGVCCGVVCVAEGQVMKCCDKPMIDSRGYPAGTYTDASGNIVTRMVVEWRCLHCGARGTA